MSQITAEAYARKLDKIARHPAMSDDNIRLRAGAGDAPSTVLIAIGVIALAATIAGGFVYRIEHALAAFEIGAVTVTALSLGAMFWIMVSYLVNAGWMVTARRQMEHVMMMLPLCVVLMGIVAVIEYSQGGVLLRWMGIDPASSHLLEKKQGFLNPNFFLLRFVVYVGLWTIISTTLWRNSITQDETGDRWLTNRSRFTSAWGMLVFALTCAFFAFDFLMSMDYRFFSTMWGVYYFATCALGAVAVTLIILCCLRSIGRLTGLVTSEHTHDLGKLLFGFTVFWAYITFSQYFLIWYANIPEETIWFTHRKTGGWENVAGMLAIGHFIIPFLILLFRDVKRHTLGVAIVAAWILLMIILDMVWVIRPMVYLGDLAEVNPGVAGWWVDIAGIVAVLAIWAGFLIRRIAAHPLVPIKDPRLDEALHHKNYV